MYVTPAQRTQHMLQWVVFGMFGAGVGNWVLCRSQYKQQRSVIRYYMTHQDSLKQYVDTQKATMPQQGNSSNSDIQTTIIEPERIDNIKDVDPRDIR